jgi:hypothetical protein
LGKNKIYIFRTHFRRDAGRRDLNLEKFLAGSAGRHRVRLKTFPDGAAVETPINWAFHAKHPKKGAAAKIGY